MGGYLVVWRMPDGGGLHLYRMSTGRTAIILRQGEWLPGGPATDASARSVLQHTVWGEITSLVVDGSAFTYDVYAGVNSPYM